MAQIGQSTNVTNSTLLPSNLSQISVNELNMYSKGDTLQSLEQSRCTNSKNGNGNAIARLPAQTVSATAADDQRNSKEIHDRTPRSTLDNSSEYVNVDNTDPSVPLYEITHAILDNLILKCADCQRYTKVSNDVPGMELYPGPGDRGVHFQCSSCAGSGSQTFKHTEKTWLEITLTVLYNLELQDRLKQGRRFFHVRQEICTFTDRMWDVICLGRTRTPTWWATLNAQITTRTDLFETSKHGSGNWALRHSNISHPIKYIDPTLADLSTDSIFEKPSTLYLNAIQIMDCQTVKDTVYFLVRLEGIAYPVWRESTHPNFKNGALIRKFQLKTESVAKKPVTRSSKSSSGFHKLNNIPESKSDSKNDETVPSGIRTRNSIANRLQAKNDTRPNSSSNSNNSSKSKSTCSKSTPSTSDLSRAFPSTKVSESNSSNVSKLSDIFPPTPIYPVQHATLLSNSAIPKLIAMQEPNTIQPELHNPAVAGGDDPNNKEMNYITHSGSKHLFSSPPSHLSLSPLKITDLSWNEPHHGSHALIPAAPTPTVATTSHSNVSLDQQKLSHPPAKRCHQCNRRQLARPKPGQELVFCARSVMMNPSQPNSAGPIEPKRQNCSQSYCRTCIDLIYQENPLSNSQRTLAWICPCCRGICTCATCTAYIAAQLPFTSDLSGQATGEITDFYSDASSTTNDANCSNFTTPTSPSNMSTHSSVYSSVPPSTFEHPSTNLETIMLAGISRPLLNIPPQSIPFTRSSAAKLHIKLNEATSKGNNRPLFTKDGMLIARETSVTPKHQHSSSTASSSDSTKMKMRGKRSHPDLTASVGDLPSFDKKRVDEFAPSTKRRSPFASSVDDLTDYHVSIPDIPSPRLSHLLEEEYVPMRSRSLQALATASSSHIPLNPITVPHIHPFMQMEDIDTTKEAVTDDLNDTTKEYDNGMEISTDDSLLASDGDPSSSHNTAAPLQIVDMSQFLNNEELEFHSQDWIESSHLGSSYNMSSYF